MLRNTNVNELNVQLKSREMKLGAAWIEAGAKTLNKLRDKVAKPPQFMAILTPDGYAYKRED